MFSANVITMTVTPAVAGARDSTVMRIFGSEIEAKTWLGGMLSRELSAKMDFCDKLVAAIELLSVDFQGDIGITRNLL
jgi:hypothetical protein